jgi:hypothetical protein
MTALPTATVTFLFTALLQRLGDRQYAKVLEEHRRLLREAFAEGPAHLSAAGAAMLPQVRSFVETHWAAIGAIAQALLREYRLSGRKIQAIVARSITNVSTRSEGTDR